MKQLISLLMVACVVIHSIHARAVCYKTKELDNRAVLNQSCECEGPVKWCSGTMTLYEKITYCKEVNPPYDANALDNRHYYRGTIKTTYGCKKELRFWNLIGCLGGVAGALAACGSLGFVCVVSGVFTLGTSCVLTAGACATSIGAAGMTCSHCKIWKCKQDDDFPNVKKGDICYAAGNPCWVF